MDLFTDNRIVIHKPYDYVKQFVGPELLKHDALLGCNHFKRISRLIVEVRFDVGNMLVEWTKFNKPTALIFRREYHNGVCRTVHIFHPDGHCVSVMHYDYP